MHHYQYANRNDFIRQNKESFLNFCDDNKLETILNTKVSNKYPSNMDEDDFVNINEAPSFLTNATLRDYQCDGCNKVNSWYLRGIGGILADEMGLGKTIQTIMFIASCKYKLGISGPHLVVTPLAVLQNWSNEFFKFCPSLTIKKLHGNSNERKSLFNNDDVINAKFDVYLTTYDVLIIEEAFFSDSFVWASITIDEGHRIKNENNKLRATLNRIKSPFRLLLTGTPLQNNLHELWALLNYILPEVFTSSLQFDEAAKISDDEVNRSFLSKARALLEDHMMLRRFKAHV
jgi:SWI/SNF-related matrix-associated actin-dependent regulator of chromatin subfamily A member 5